MTALERFLYLILTCALVTGLGASFLRPEFYVSVLSAEDGILEWGTALFLIIASLACVSRAFTRGKERIFVLMSALGALILFFGAGEEISWGQRVFGWASGDFWVENNDQAETNLHNLVVGEVKINKLIFGALLTLAFLLYFLALPALFARSDKVARWANTWGIPVPKWHHGVAFVVGLIVMSLVPTGRSAELGEFAIGLLLAMVVLRPANFAALR
jgi:membrane associated rhomboid family serine protease